MLGTKQYFVAEAMVRCATNHGGGDCLAPSNDGQHLLTNFKYEDRIRDSRIFFRGIYRFVIGHDRNADHRQCKTPCHAFYRHCIDHYNLWNYRDEKRFKYGKKKNQWSVDHSPISFTFITNFRSFISLIFFCRIPPSSIFSLEDLRPL